MSKKPATPAITRVLVGQHPATKVIHRLLFYADGSVRIERTPYVSPLDGWTQSYPAITEEASKHVFLILTLEQHPAVWPE